MSHWTMDGRKYFNILLPPPPFFHLFVFSFWCFILSDRNLSRKTLLFVDIFDFKIIFFFSFFQLKQWESDIFLFLKNSDNVEIWKEKKKNSFLPLDIREYEKKRIKKSKCKKYFLINYFKYLKNTSGLFIHY